MKKERIRMKKAVKIFAVVVLLGIVLTSTASATIHGHANIQDHNNRLSDTGRLWGGGLTGGTYYTGIYSWTNTLAPSTTGWGELVPHWGFCIELTQGANNGWVNVIDLNEAPLPTNSSYGTPMGDVNANYIRELWQRNFDPNWTIGPKDDTESKMAEAFGAAVWEIIYQPGGPATWDVNDGWDGTTGFEAKGIEMAYLANEWLDSLTGNGPFAPNLCAISPTDEQRGQDYVVQLTGPDIPEPATMALLGFGALSLIRRKRIMWLVPTVRQRRTKLKRN